MDPWNIVGWCLVASIGLFALYWVARISFEIIDDIKESVNVYKLKKQQDDK